MLTENQLQILKTDLFTTRANQVHAGKTFAIHIAESNYKALIEFYNSPTNNLTALAQRFATNFEFLFTTSNVSSLYGYILTEDDIREATQIN